MAEKRDELLAAWHLVGETLARLDRRRMADLLQTAAMIADAHRASVAPIVASLAGVSDLDRSTAN